MQLGERRRTSNTNYTIHTKLMLFDDFVWQLCYNDFVINVKTFFWKKYIFYLMEVF